TREMPAVQRLGSRNSGDDADLDAAEPEPCAVRALLVEKPTRSIEPVSEVDVEQGLRRALLTRCRSHESPELLWGPELGFGPASIPVRAQATMGAHGTPPQMGPIERPDPPPPGPRPGGIDARPAQEPTDAASATACEGTTHLGAELGMPLRDQHVTATFLEGSIE